MWQLVSPNDRSDVYVLLGAGKTIAQTDDGRWDIDGTRVRAFGTSHAYEKFDIDVGVVSGPDRQELRARVKFAQSGSVWTRALGVEVQW
jgi:hypothetical protein